MDEEEIMISRGDYLANIQEVGSFMIVEYKREIEIDDKLEPYLLFGLYKHHRVWKGEEWKLGYFIQLKENDKPNYKFNLNYEDVEAFEEELSSLRGLRLTWNEQQKVEKYMTIKKQTNELQFQVRMEKFKLSSDEIKKKEDEIFENTKVLEKYEKELCKKIVD